jgi:hypothetical protein
LQKSNTFAEIWVPWLRVTMGRTPEPEDIAIMAEPARYYRDHDGEVFLATLDAKIVGAVAVLGIEGFRIRQTCRP